MATQPSLLFTHRSWRPFWPTPLFLPFFDAGAASWMQRARCQKTYHQVPFRKVGTRQPTDRPTLIPYPLFHSLSLSLQPLPSLQTPVFLYPARLQHLEQRGFAFNTSGRILKNWQGYPRSPNCVSVRVWGGIQGGLLSPGLDQAGCQTWPNLKLGFGEGFFFTRGDKRPYLLLRPWIKGTLRN